MKLVILGAGFGGLRLARRLSHHKNIQVTLIDRFNYHQFQPLFYQVATAGLDASNISFPIRKVFQHTPNVQIRLATVHSIDLEQQQVITSTGTVSYDKLVIATGAGTNFFNSPKLEAHAFSMKSTVEALQIRHRLLQNVEDATQAREQQDVERLQRLLNVVIVGAGPTGVELSGAIADMKRFQLPKDFPELDFSQMKIYLLEGTGKTLAAMSEASSRQSQAYLERLGVTVMTHTLLEDYDGQTVRLKDGTLIPSNLVIWAAGIKGNVPA
ncbi:MAG TPA: FAD-dependent oxidoreductase, partial [Ferruginibacter sp.]|nr:FAD-dependent oxidoreductase [Ferruginibacter sp.]